MKQSSESCSLRCQRNWLESELPLGLLPYQRKGKGHPRTGKRSPFLCCFFQCLSNPLGWQSLTLCQLTEERYSEGFCMLSCFSRVWLFVTVWTVDCQAPLSMGFPKQEYWSGLPFPSPRDLPDQGSNSGLLHCRQIHYCLNHQGSPCLGSNPDFTYN